MSRSGWGKRVSFEPGLEQVDARVGERERLGPPLDVEPRKVKKQTLIVLAPNLQIVDLLRATKTLGRASYFSTTSDKLGCQKLTLYRYLTPLYCLT